MGAMSSKYNATLEKASRAYDADRDGFVIVMVAACWFWKITIMPKPEAQKIYGELVGYGATLTAQTWLLQMRRRCSVYETSFVFMRTASQLYQPHGTSTPVAMSPNLKAIREVFEPVNRIYRHFINQINIGGIRWAQPAFKSNLFIADDEKNGLSQVSIY